MMGSLNKDQLLLLLMNDMINDMINEMINEMTNEVISEKVTHQKMINLKRHDLNL
jgi:hypothetical protein